MNYYFDSLGKAIPDSMTELQFGWNIIAPLTHKIRCGHTSFSMSNNWYRFIRDKRLPSFPIFLKIWGDTMMVTGNYNRSDSVFKRGTFITSVNGMNAAQLTGKMLQYLPTDGYANNVNYIRISANFPYYHRQIFGTYKNYSVGYIDSNGNEKKAIVPLWVPPADTGSTKAIAKKPKPDISIKQLKKERLESYRSLQIDSINHTAVFTLNTFSTGGGKRLKHFIKQTFKTLQKENIQNLVIDLRINGGGNIGAYALLTKYIRHQPFKVADSAYAIAKFLTPYTGRIKQGWLTNMGLFFFTTKRSDGNYHFGYYERKTFKPKKKNHFNGHVYVLISGPTFSASTLFCNAVKGQANVTLIGEETGGGWHGNSGIVISDIVLPKTKLRVRLPFFKIVQYNHIEKNGSGVVPDIYVPPNSVAIKNMIDQKMQTALELIKNKKE
ncbi:MAG TPA: S41 family peptidase [Ferruginibacter sp.]|nr:S41 family peptidase [Ferruginibacter sp.]HMP19899.1 S41 family peptidase [Ferruginibacter sp.]